MTIYKGFPGGRVLIFTDHDPNPVILWPQRSLKVYNHSPTGFAWGYLGSGPAQLALALLLEETDQDTALRLHQRFKAEIIARLKGARWAISDLVIQQWLKRQPAPTSPAPEQEGA